MVLVSVYRISHSREVLSQNDSYTIALKSVNDNRALSMLIGISEAESILFELNKTKTPFPLSHDLIKDTLTILDAEIDKVVITELNGDIYHSVVTMVKDGEYFRIDSRPSDAIALALRFDAPIYVSNEVMRLASHLIEEDELIKDSDFVPRPKEEILRDMLESAVREENYEEAARLRDEIKRLNKE